MPSAEPKARPGGRTAGWRGRIGAAMAAIGVIFCVTAAANRPVQAAEAAPAGQRLHVPSPDWRDQIIYFVLTDRFDDGDPANNNQGAGEYDPADNARYSGGDLEGIRDRLDYIHGLGATALWITPPVAHQWWNTATRYGGYHGYWGDDFMAVDKHYGNLEDYKRLSDALHRKGMYLVQDIVVNHTANYFAYPNGWNAKDPTSGFVLHADAQGKRAPTQFPFTRNDARDPAQRKAAIYHWTPDIADFANRDQELNFQLAGLDDLNTENPVVRDALRASYGYWIREVGVDAFRVDTAFLVPPEFFRDFLYADDARHPGVLRVAEGTGRKQFHLFGEGFGTDKAYAEAQARKLQTYMRDAEGKPLLPAMINFPLYGTAVDVFARGKPTAELAYRIDSMMRLHAQPHLMPSFIDNHDVDRFLTSGDAAGLKQGLLLLMTLPGIPTIYYGTEQAFTEQRGAMFARGYGSGGRDRFDARSPLYRYLQRATALRRTHRVFSRGTPTVLQSNAAAPGVLAYRMAHDDSAALVVFNSSDSEALLDNLDTGLPPGTRLKGIFDIDGAADDAVVGAQGRLTLPLPPRSGRVWQVTRERADVPTGSASIVLDALSDAPVRGDFAVRGVARDVSSFKLIVDGDLASAQTIRPQADGRWRAVIDTSAMIDRNVGHTLVAWDARQNIASERHDFRVSREWKQVADVRDPAGDDVGPTGRYRYPDDAAWRDRRPADIQRVQVWSAGGALRIALRMNAVTRIWNPDNGFDHVAFTLFLQLPGAEGGARVMPQQNAVLPDDMRWHLRLRAHGWSNALFGAQGATDRDEGTPLTPSADIAVDEAENTVTFTLPARALGKRQSLAGLKLYATTWDYDGGYRKLTPDGSAGGFGGGDGNVSALVMDDTAVLVLP